MDGTLDKPFKYTSKSGGHYLIFPNATFASLDLSDCNDALHGVCLEDVNTVEECIERGRDERYVSGAGYFIKSKTGKKYCVPIRTAIHPFLNPALRLRRKEVHPELEDMASWAFLNVDMYPFPAENADVVTYQDKFLLQHVSSGMYARVPLERNNVLSFSKSLSSALALQFLPYHDTFFKDQIYIPVRLEYSTLLSVPETNLVLKREGTQAKWTSELSSDVVIEDEVMMHSVKEVVGDSHDGVYRGVGDGVKHERVRPLSFKDTFYITMGGFVLSVNSLGETTLENVTDWHSETVLKQSVFRLVPRVEVWSYEGGLHAVPLDVALEKGWKVYRSPYWGLHETRPFASLVLVDLLVVILFSLVYKCWVTR